MSLKKSLDKLNYKIRELERAKCDLLEDRIRSGNAKVIYVIDNRIGSSRYVSGHPVIAESDDTVFISKLKFFSQYDDLCDSWCEAVEHSPRNMENDPFQEDEEPKWILHFDIPSCWNYGEFPVFPILDYSQKQKEEYEKLDRELEETIKHLEEMDRLR